MSQVIKISKAGNNVVTETDPDDLIYSSDYNSLKYYLSGGTTISITGDGSEKTSEVTISHNLGYVPYFIVYSDGPNLFSGSYSIVPYYSENNPSAGNKVYCEAFCGTANLTLKFTNKSANSYTANFYYKIYRNILGI